MAKTIMKKTVTLTATLIAMIALLAITSREASTQVSGSLPSYVKLQSSTPGTAQTGHGNITGTMIAGTFQGSGSGLTGLPWSSVVGAPSSFPPSGAAGGALTGTYPNPTIALNSVDSGNLVFDAGSLSKVTNGQMSVNGGFVGIGTSTPIGSSRFVVNQQTSNFGGMYVNTLGSGLPFYGYSQAGAIAAYTYVDGANSNRWKLHVGTSDLLTVTPTGYIGIGTEDPSTRLDVAGHGKIVVDNGSTAGFISVGPAFTVSTPSGDGVYATTSANGYWACIGYSSGTTGYGVYGRFDGSSGAGVRGRADNASAYAGVFEGKVSVTGTLSKGGGSFKIDHPLDPTNKYLYHSFVESPDMMNIYNGIVTTDSRGYATVTMPEWFDAVNRDFRYALTVIDSADSDQFVLAKVVREMSQNHFTLRTNIPHAKVSWMVTGIRKDAFANAHRIPVEEEKPASERGTYLYPREAGQPASLSLSAKMDSMHGASLGRP